MRQKGLLFKVKLQVVILLVLCFHLTGSYSQNNSTLVKAYETEPTITITSPKTGDVLKDTTITITGTLANFGSVVTLKLYKGTEVIQIKDVTEQNWSMTLLLTEGNYSYHVVATDSENLTDTSEILTFTVDTTSPTIAIDTPINGAFTKSFFLKGTTEANAKINLCTNCRLEGEQIIGTWEESVTADETGAWTYEDINLADASYTVFVKATDQAGNNSVIVQRSFILDKTRPKITLPTLENNTELLAKPDMTQVPVDTNIRVKIVETNTLDKNLIEENGISLTVNGSNTLIPGIITYNSTTKEITFNPNDLLLSGKKYKVVVNSEYIRDAAANPAYPKTWTFMTASNPSEAHKNPHGNYSNNTNTCANCHSTHVARENGLLAKKNPDGSIKQEEFAVDNYCMACHDGTVVPGPENSNTTHAHKAAVTMDGKPSGSSCASCHNPHLDWSEENPNLTQDHIVYKHVDGSLPSSSKEQLCEACHDADMETIAANPAVDYRLFGYKKSNDAVGILEDYELCLRCHNERFRQKYMAVPVIEDFYNNWTLASKDAFEDNASNPPFADRDLTEEKKFSAHIIRAKDGSPLAGHMPCAECHDTHGSNNIKSLKKKLGHENIKTDFVAETGEWVEKIDGNWIAKNERAFCLKCHNGETEVYGVVGKAIYGSKATPLTPPVIEHNSSEAGTPCSTCHGVSTTANASDEVMAKEKALSAAHAPKK